MQYEQTWSLYEEYSNALGEMANEDWISFRLVYPVGLVQWTLQYGHVFVRVVAILYKTMPKLSTLLKSGQLVGSQWCLQ